MDEGAGVYRIVGRFGVILGPSNDHKRRQIALFAPRLHKRLAVVFAGGENRVPAGHIAVLVRDRHAPLVDFEGVHSVVLPSCSRTTRGSSTPGFLLVHALA
jgi:hypothetical protein